MHEASFAVYILQCSDKTLYTGITNDIDRRLLEHNENNKKGAKYTKTRRPVKVIYTKYYKNRSEAQKNEIKIKKMSRKMKISLIKDSMQKNDRGKSITKNTITESFSL